MVIKKMISIQLIFSVGFSLVATEVRTHASTLGSIERDSGKLSYKSHINHLRKKTRLDHAKELLGSHYHRSVARVSEKVIELDPFITVLLQKYLKGVWKKQAKEIAHAIIQESDKYKFDPMFLLAVIGNESSFNPLAVGTSGEIGLMQILPTTGEWISKKYEFKWQGKDTLKNPIENIRIGAAYLSYLREMFKSKSQFYLAAYNMGSGNVRRAIENETLPKVYPTRVMRRYLQFYTQLQQES